eukprot:scaffold12491_cov95-Isochrysis_galbana.AAC.1
MRCAYWSSVPGWETPKKPPNMDEAMPSKLHDRTSSPLPSTSAVPRSQSPRNDRMTTGGAAASGASVTGWAITTGTPRSAHAVPTCSASVYRSALPRVGVNLTVNCIGVKVLQSHVSVHGSSTAKGSASCEQTRPLELACRSLEEPDAVATERSARRADLGFVFKRGPAHLRCAGEDTFSPKHYGFTI